MCRVWRYERQKQDVALRQDKETQIPTWQTVRFRPGKGLRERMCSEGKQALQLEENNKVAKGTIRRLMKDRGYEFIIYENGKDVFFNHPIIKG